MWVYILHSEGFGRYYVGMSEDVEKRLAEHNVGRVMSTKGYKPWKVVYKEKCKDREEARKREKYLKSAAGRRYRKNILGH
jgi:putative endonuclease